MKYIKNTNKKAFTLVETLLYVVVLGICLGAMSGFIDMINAAKAKNRLVLSIERQGENISELISDNIKRSSGINSPIANSESNSLSLAFSDGSKNPTIFNLSGGVIYIKEGVSPAVPLSSPLLVAENLSFKNISRTGTPGNIQASFSLRSLEQGRAEFSYKQNFSSSASRRF